MLSEKQAILPFPVILRISHSSDLPKMTTLDIKQDALYYSKLQLISNSYNLSPNQTFLNSRIYTLKRTTSDLDLLSLWTVSSTQFSSKIFPPSHPSPLHPMSSILYRQSILRVHSSLTSQSIFLLLSPFHYPAIRSEVFHRSRSPVPFIAHDHQTSPISRPSTPVMNHFTTRDH